jgi:hypothetical protein
MTRQITEELVYWERMDPQDEPDLVDESSDPGEEPEIQSVTNE